MFSVHYELDHYLIFVSLQKNKTIFLCNISIDILNIWVFFLRIELLIKQLVQKYFNISLECTNVILSLLGY